MAEEEDQNILSLVLDVDEEEMHRVRDEIEETFRESDLNYLAAIIVLHALDTAIARVYSDETGEKDDEG